MKTFYKIFILGVCLILILTAIFSATFLIITKGCAIDDKKLTNTQRAAIVCDLSGKEITQISTEKATTSVDISNLPNHVKYAFISIEDKNFYKHKGLDYLRMGKAFIKNLKSRSFKEGASTISQQLIKNTHLTNEKTITRKLKEIRLTKKLERKYTKEQILQAYLNSIYFGYNCFGIESASHFYFNKKAQNLTVAESALLAALIKAPNNYSPFTNPEKSLKRRNLVISKMQEYGYIDDNLAKSASTTPLPKKDNLSQNSQIYIKGIYKELESVLNFSPYFLTNGCKIYTYINENEQNYIENLNTTADRSGKIIIIIDNKTHGISAFFSTEGNQPRQPGSLIKPLAVYAPAFEENLIVPCSPILDEKVDFNGYKPSNFDGKYCGYVSIRDAISKSLNIPAVKILNSVGTEKSAEYLKKLNLEIKENDKHLALALGGISSGFTFDKLVGAYTVFANDGNYIQPRFIEKIVDSSGKILYKNNSISKKVFSSSTVSFINDALYNTSKNGTAKKLSNLTFEVCAKTGTNGTKKGNTDAYTVTYTPDKTVGVWMGNYNNTTTDLNGGGLPCHYAYLINKQIYKNKSISKFKTSNDIISVNLDKDEYLKNHKLVLADEFSPKENIITEIFKKNYLPTEKSNKFSKPEIPTPTIYYKNNAIFIELCHAEYYYYLIKRENNGKIITIYDDKSINTFKDTNIRKNQKYTYTITPYVKDNHGNMILGKSITLPSVYTKQDYNYDKALSEILNE